MTTTNPGPAPANAILNCCLSATPADPNCDFKATTPGAITLKVEGTSGSVQFLIVKYNGTTLIDNTPVDQVSFTIVSGKKKLEIVYTFSDPTNGKGSLKEVCSNPKVLKAVDANNPAVSHIICA